MSTPPGSRSQAACSAGCTSSTPGRMDPRRRTSSGHRHRLHLTRATGSAPATDRAMAPAHLQTVLATQWASRCRSSIGTSPAARQPQGRAARAVHQAALRICIQSGTARRYSTCTHTWGRHHMAPAQGMATRSHPALPLRVRTYRNSLGTCFGRESRCKGC